MKNNKWTTETLQAEAIKYENRRDFRNGSPKAWHSAVSRRVVDDICGHMVLLTIRKPPTPINKVLEAIDGRGITLLEYAGSSTGLSKFQCQVDGHEWVTTASSVMHGTGCLRCSGRLQKTLDEVVAEMLVKNIKVVRYAGTVSGMSDLACTVDGCGYTWKASVSSAKYLKGGCTRCSNRENLTKEQVDERLLGRDIKMTRYSGRAVLHKSSFLCTKPGCGHEWDTIAQSVLRGSGCQKCAGNLQLTPENVVVRLAARGIDLVEYGGKLKARSKLKCCKCGLAWETNVDSVINANCGCPSCAKSSFNPNKEATLYAYRIQARHTDYLGFGISNVFKRRDSQHRTTFKKHGVSADLVFSYNASGVAVQGLERRLKEVLPIFDTGIDGFRTEAILWDQQEADKLRHVARLMSEQFPQNPTG